MAWLVPGNGSAERLLAQSHGRAGGNTRREVGQKRKGTGTIQLSGTSKDRTGQSMEATTKSVMDHDDEGLRAGVLDRKGRGRGLYSYQKHPRIGQDS